MLNTNFNKALSDSGKSMYGLAKLSGVPYTTINEICRGKNDINQCACGTVKRLAVSLGVDMDRILNDINYLDGVKGKYKGIDYVWQVGEDSQINFCYEGEEVTLGVGRIYNIPSRVEYYNIIARWMIKEYIAGRQWKKDVAARIERIRKDER